jgi:hypothetical protein
MVKGDEEEEVSSYWITLRKRKDTGIERGSAIRQSLGNLPLKT